MDQLAHVDIEVDVPAIHFVLFLFEREGLKKQIKFIESGDTNFRPVKKVRLECGQLTVAVSIV